jgi:hypothetical protein
MPFFFQIHLSCINLIFLLIVGMMRHCKIVLFCNLVCCTFQWWFATPFKTFQLWFGHFIWIVGVKSIFLKLFF